MVLFSLLDEALKVAFRLPRFGLLLFLMAFSIASLIPLMLLLDLLIEP